jgi:hypothetical protein
MEAFFCSDCGSEHDEPADAGLGHLIICLECTFFREMEAYRGTEVSIVDIAPGLAA